MEDPDTALFLGPERGEQEERVHTSHHFHHLKLSKPLNVHYINFAFKVNVRGYTTAAS